MPTRLPSSTHRLSDSVSPLYTMDSDAAWRALLQRATAGVHGSLNADHGTVRAACFALLEWACGHWQAAPPPPRSEGLMQMALHRASAPRGRRPWHWPGSASSRPSISGRGTRSSPAMTVPPGPSPAVAVAGSLRGPGPLCRPAPLAARRQWRRQSAPRRRRCPAHQRSPRLAVGARRPRPQAPTALAPSPDPSAR